MCAPFKTARSELLPVILCLALAHCCWGASPTADEITDGKAQALFQHSFSPNLKLKHRRKALCRVVADYKNTRWADDALWVLAELADGTGHRVRTLQYREKLLKNATTPKLEAFTKTTKVYRDSRLPIIVRVLELTGRCYLQDKKKRTPVNPPKFNPLPMVLHDQVGLAYTRMQKLKEALRQYKAAQKASPKRGLFWRHYQKTIRDLERKIRSRNAAVKEKATTFARQGVSAPCQAEPGNASKTSGTAR